MRIWFDTEFIEDGRTIDLLSIGMIREDGATYYAEPAEADRSRASEWVRENVFPHLSGPVKSRSEIAAEIRAFAGESPEFWAYYADYDWVALCQLYGTMMDLPKGWPKFCRDVQQLRVERSVAALPEQRGVEHNALADAIWTREAHAFLLAAPEAPAPAVRVKPLRWEPFGENLTARGEPVGTYAVLALAKFEARLDGISIGKFQSYDEAKSAAQAHYERRILSAIDITTPDLTTPEEAAKKDFNRGYVLACCNLVTFYDAPSTACYLLREAGISWSHIDDLGLDQDDLALVHEMRDWEGGE